MKHANVCRSCGDLTWLLERVNTLGNWGGREFWICPDCSLPASE